ncbi:MAG: pyruvate kinase [Deltaproteobacteria bacterium]|nr:pyruvate kinase [Deltaproteobacteria bacterium]
MRRTKIVCTLGPASHDEAIVAALIRAGMNVARLNFSHGSHDDHRRVYETVRRVAAELGAAVAVMQDLQGPKLRLGRLPGGPITLEVGELVPLVLAEQTDEPRSLPCPHPHLAEDLSLGCRVLLDDGRLELVLESKEAGRLLCRVRVGGEVSDRKGVNLPGARLSIPAVTEKDRRDLAFGRALGVDFVALSFVRGPEDVRAAQEAAPELPLLAKIEKPEGVARFGEILPLVHGVLVARGDLGVEMGPEQVPLLQKRLIEEANACGKLVVTATEMLDSMQERSRPTRAEVSDVANAVLDGSDAVMLSGETARGRYPVEAVRTMDRVIRETEGSARFRGRPSPSSLGYREATSAIARAAVSAAEELSARCIVVLTSGGATVELLSEYRPKVPILALTADEGLCRRLAFEWGVLPRRLATPPTSVEEAVAAMSDAARSAGLASPGDPVVLVMGSHPGGASDLIKAHYV